MSNETLLAKARSLYNNRGYDWGPYISEFGGASVDGIMDTDNDGRLDIDCSHLVHKTLIATGYNIPYMTTAVLNSPEANVYFDEIPLDEASPGNDDLILYRGHVAIFESYDPSYRSGTFFGSQSNGPDTGRFKERKTSSRDWGTDCKILRPKKTTQDSFCSNNTPAYEIWSLATPWQPAL